MALQTSELQENIAAYEELSDYLETALLGKWVVFHNRELVESFDDFQDAAAEAVKQFGRGPYLIRQVGATAHRFPTSLMLQQHV